MPTRPNLPAGSAGSRRRAEKRLRRQPPGTGPARKEADTERLVLELEGRSIQLEMQNQQLQQARKELEAGLEKYRELYDFAPVGYLTLDREGIVREANLTLASLLGIERARLVQRRFGLWVFAADQPGFSAFLAKVFESKGRESCEVRMLKEGKPPVEVRLEAAVAASGQECRVVVRDITERKRAERDFLVLSKIESTGLLAGGIAHDFNNLLAVILLDLEMVQALAPASEQLALYLEQAKQTAVTAHGLTKQLLSFAKEDPPVRKPIRLSALIQESTRLALSGSRVRSEFSLADGLWPVEADARQLGQVIRNVVLNAREAIPQGGTVSVRAENVVLGPRENPSLPPGVYVRISIADQGCGIPKEVLPRIFDPYFSTKQRGEQKGMGLGLTICHRVIQEHGGAISVESPPGGGTTFHLHLPASGKLIEEKRVPRPKAPLRHGRILVMDDEELMRKAVGQLLELMGHTVELVEDGQSAVELYREAKNLGRPFDAVILDLTVRAGLGGQAALQALLKLDPAVKAVVMSGYADDPLVLHPESHGFMAALEKPFDSAKIQDVLGRVLGPRDSGK